jgi:hypothetical protein
MAGSRQRLASASLLTFSTDDATVAAHRLTPPRRPRQRWWYLLSVQGAPS